MALKRIISVLKHPLVALALSILSIAFALYVWHYPKPRPAHLETFMSIDVQLVSLPQGLPLRLVWDDELGIHRNLKIDGLRLTRVNFRNSALLKVKPADVELVRHDAISTPWSRFALFWASFFLVIASARPRTGVRRIHGPR